MRIAVIGGGPGGLFTGILARKAFPTASVVVHERNRPGETFGWGVVFSDETLGNVEEADPESFARIRREFAYWTDIDTYVAEAEVVRSTGHGFCGLARKTLLEILEDRAREVGVELRHESEVTRDELERDADLVVAADGINSVIRDAAGETFGPTIDERVCHFCWLGTTKPLDAFTFVFRENEHGVFNVHAYPFERGDEPRSTWIVECDDATWRNAGLDRADEAATVDYVSRLFADHLDGYEVLTNKSIWRTFPTIACESWVDGNVVLLGDAAHTAHFSIGSGTKLAMEDAIDLVAALDAERTGPDSSNVDRALARYMETRHVDVLKTQKAAQTSLEWFEHSGRYMDQDPVLFTFNLMTRSKRITYDNLAERDPEIVARTLERFAELEGVDARTLSAPAFAPLDLAGTTLRNRVVVSPMCQYSAEDGAPVRWHDVHYGALSVGGAGLVFTEMTNVSAEGRITHGCTGIWSDDQERRWAAIVAFAHEHGAAKVGIQLGHAGRKASYSLPWEGDAPLDGDAAWQAIGPTGRPFTDGSPAPRAMDRADMDRVLDEYRAATERSLRAGFDVVEVHAAHGYLLSSFLSPAVNDRDDEYGGSRLEDRARFPLEVVEAVRELWPSGRPLFVRVSATDWLDGRGQTVDDTVRFARMLEERGVDVVDVSSAGNVPDSKPVYGRMYQVPFAERIRYETGLKVMAVGAIVGMDHANTIIAAGRADLAAMARPHLVEPHLVLSEANARGQLDQHWPKQYLAARRS